MRTHSEIIRSIPRLDQFARQRGVSLHTARSWIQRNRIPAEHWKAVADERIASLDELAEAAAAASAKAAIADDNRIWNGFISLPRRPGGKVVTQEMVNALLDELD